MSFCLENCKYNFASDTINIFVLVYDESGSMQDYISDMKKANTAFKNDFSKFEEKESVAIAKAIFDESFNMKNFDSVNDFSTDYRAGGGTALYDAIIYAKQNTLAYYDEIVKRLNIRPRVTFLVFSDGGDNRSSKHSGTAKEAITELNSMDVTTVFVAFGDAIKQEIGSQLGFSCTRDIDNASELILCMGSELSKSCKEQSKSAYSLHSEFFSKAKKDADDDNKDEAPLIQDDFFNV